MVKKCKLPNTVRFSTYSNNMIIWQKETQPESFDQNKNSDSNILVITDAGYVKELNHRTR